MIILAPGKALASPVKKHRVGGEVGRGVASEEVEETQQQQRAPLNGKHSGDCGSG